MDKKAYDLLTQQKLDIEAEIDAILSELTSGVNPPGISGSLVDAEGFPRSDIDLYNVRSKRQRLACLKNDYTQVMKDIETEIIRLHSQHKPAVNPSNPAKLPKKFFQEEQPTTAVFEDLKPFATIQSVDKGSPSEEADFRPGDHILKFGTANSTNHRELLAIADILKNNFEKAINVLVRRDNSEVLKLQVTPKAWRGRGHLGCHIVPYSEK